MALGACVTSERLASSPGSTSNSRHEGKSGGNPQYIIEYKGHYTQIVTKNMNAKGNYRYLNRIEEHIAGKQRLTSFRN